MSWRRPRRSATWVCDVGFLNTSRKTLAQGSLPTHGSAQRKQLICGSESLTGQYFRCLIVSWSITQETTMKNDSTLVLGCMLALFAGCADVPGGESTGSSGQEVRHTTTGFN